MGVAGRFKSAALSLTMKHVLRYGTMERDTQTGVGGRCEPAADSVGEWDALADLEEDAGTQLATGLPATTTSAQD
jgi:hypothetical protein